MRRLVVLVAACALLGACSTRALHAQDDLWEEGDSRAAWAASLDPDAGSERPVLTD